MKPAAFRRELANLRQTVRDEAALLPALPPADDAAAWHDSHDDPSFLYRGTQLTVLQQAATRWLANPARYPALTGTQRDFLHTSQRVATRSTRQRRGIAAGPIAGCAPIGIGAATCPGIGSGRGEVSCAKNGGKTDDGSAEQNG